jgi:EAL domain-containing protein (putative c-di-GMP-specific phosphodiesterase class I)
LGLNVIPEGVETEEQLQLLMQYHCQTVQGFYFGKEPLEAEAMTKLLKSDFKIS